MVKTEVARVQSEKGRFEKIIGKNGYYSYIYSVSSSCKESGWGTSRFALEGNAIFGQWTWSGQGIAPLDRESDKNHKILKFPILRHQLKHIKII